MDESLSKEEKQIVPNKLYLFTKLWQIGDDWQYTPSYAIQNANSNHIQALGEQFIIAVWFR